MADLFTAYGEQQLRAAGWLPAVSFWICPTNGARYTLEEALTHLKNKESRMKSVLQDWVMELGLRHQGTLLTAVRGCDTAPKDDPSKMFVRCLRAAILNAHCGEAKKAKTFIEHVDVEELIRRFNAFRRSVDHYPHHYVMHLIHAVEIIGYKMPNGGMWHGFYVALVHALHLNIETEMELDHRLNASEEEFAARDWTCDGPIVE